MLRRSILTFALVVAAATAGCGRGEKSASASSGDPALDAYRVELAPLAPLESDALEALATCTGQRYTDDATVLHALRDRSIPRYQEYIAGLKKLRAAGAEELHARVIAVAERELAVLEKLARALERGDGTAVLCANHEHRALRGEVVELLASVDRARTPVTPEARTVEAAAGKPR